jgi:hypothetical protein
MPKIVRERHSNLLAKHILDQILPFVPGYLAGDQHGLWIAGHSILRIAN